MCREFWEQRGALNLVGALGEVSRGEMTPEWSLRVEKELG